MKYILKEMSQMEKPREKLYYLGPSSLSDYELLAIILRTGAKEKSVIDVSLEILDYFDNIHALQNITLEELMKFKGIGKIKAIELLAVIEFGKRINDYTCQKYYIRSPKDSYLYLKNKLSYLEQEHFIAIYLTINNQVITYKTISIGSNISTIADSKTVIKWGLKLSTYAIIISHNHPSGDPFPSEQDIIFTNQLQKACKTVDIIFVDHIIIGKNRYFSIKEKSIFNE